MEGYDSYVDADDDVDDDDDITHGIYSALTLRLKAIQFGQQIVSIMNPGSDRSTPL